MEHTLMVFKEEQKEIEVGKRSLADNKVSATVSTQLDPPRDPKKKAKTEGEMDNMDYFQI
jgi:hypothetical protein